jgi:hypothetical protein
MTAAISTTTSVGAALAGITYARTGNYNLFLTITSITVLIGALLFMTLPAVSRRAPEALQWPGRSNPPPPARSADDAAAVHADRLTSDIAAVFRHQPGAGVGDVVRARPCGGPGMVFSSTSAESGSAPYSAPTSGSA